MKSSSDKEPSLFDELLNKKEMDPMAKMRDKYLQELKRRGEESRAYQSHQLTGLEIANILGDWKRKSLYMKLAKKHGESKMLQMAKEVAEKKEVANRGAYFMRMLENEIAREKRNK